MNRLKYPHTIRPLTVEEGCGYLIEFPDLPGCISDGETIEEAIRNGHDAVRGWIAATREAQRLLPSPPWPALPQVPMPGSILRSLPPMAPLVRTSGPLPISVAPLPAGPTRPSS